MVSAARGRRAQWSLLLVLSMAAALIQAAPNTIAAGITPATAAPSEAKCQINIKGTAQGGISSASMQCTGGVVAAAVDEQLLGSFKASGFKGVTWDNSCVTPGSLLTICGSTKVVIVDSSITGIQSRDNRRLVVLHAANTTHLTLKDSSIDKNKALALGAFNQSRVVVSRSRLAGNEAFNNSAGAGAAAYNNATLIITDRSMVVGNVAHNRSGAGVRVRDGAYVQIMGASKVCNNTVYSTGGGGVVVFDNAQLIITGSSLICNNTSVNGSGGGVIVSGSAQLTITGRSKVRNNINLNHRGGGGVALFENAHGKLTGSSLVCNNTSIHGSGGGILVVGTAQLTITSGSKVCNNTSGDSRGGDPGVFGSGGGVAVFDSAHVNITGSSLVFNNTSVNGSGGGVAAFDKSVIHISGASLVCNNTCAHGPYSGGGAGVAVLGSAHLNITGDSLVCNNTSVNSNGSGAGVIVAQNSTAVISGRSSVANNKVLSVVDSVTWAGGGVVTTETALVLVVDSSVVDNYVQGSGAGVVSYANSTAIITNSIIANNTCEPPDNMGGAGVWAGENTTVVINGSSRVVGNHVEGGAGGAVALLDVASLTLGTGVSFVNNSVSQGNVGSNIAAYGNSTLDIRPGVLWEGRELTKCSTSVYLGRLPCEPGEYETAGLCQCCPVHTYGFAASASSCMPCPRNAVCPGGSAVLPADGYWHSSPKSVQMHKCPMSTAACGAGGSCTKGYLAKSNLCGECSEGYGHTLPFKCTKCMAPAHQLAVYCVLTSVTVLLMAVTVHFTWQDNQMGDKALRPSDLIKVLVQFLQYLVILGSLSVPWPGFLSGLLSAATVVFGAASGQALSIDCWLKHYSPGWLHIPLAVQRQLLFFAATLVMLTAVLLVTVTSHFVKRLWRQLWLARRVPHPRAAALHLWSKLKVAVLVVAFYAYPALVKAALSFFACLRIDRADVQPYPEYSIRNHTAGYWVSAIQQECFVGWHKGWALGFGLPAVLLLCLGVPSGLLWFLLANRNRVGQRKFQLHFGFLYRNFTDSKVWWEAVWAAQTVLLTAVSVFSYMLQAYYAVFLMGMILLLSTALQLVARPYAQRKLHRLHLAATACLFYSAWLSLALFSGSVEARPESLQPIHTAVGALIVVINVLFILWCVHTIVKVAAPTVQTSAQQAAAWLQSCCRCRSIDKQKAKRAAGKSFLGDLYGLRQDREQQAAPVVESSQPHVGGEHHGSTSEV